jgi:hypothetical protein
MFRRWYEWYKAWGWIPCALLVGGMGYIMACMLSGDYVDPGGVVAVVLGLSIGIAYIVVSRRSTRFPEKE